MSLKRPGPQAIVIFGASGDLTARKVIPGLYNLFLNDLLPEHLHIIGYARSLLSDDEFLTKMHDAIKANSRTGIDEKRWAEFSRCVHYVSGEYGDADGLAELIPFLHKADQELGPDGQHLFYCATPPDAFPLIVEGLGALGLAKNSRIVIEKPFGHDLESARQLNALLHRWFDEKQIFRIDHYLGKETVQNILVFRFANGMFEPTWNRRYVSLIQIDVAEDIGIGGRGAFYEQAGAVRDIVQNHIMQLIAILAMEPPAAFDAESIRDEKVKLLRAVQPFDLKDAVKGQYTAGEMGGQRVLGYREEPDVPPDSTTETFVAGTLWIENWRWEGVPIFIRTGKRLAKRETTISVQFMDAPLLLFEQSGIQRPEPNHLTIRVQPNEGITLTFDAKVPGPEMHVVPVDMDFSYDESFMTEPAEAYERLLHDAMAGDATLFTRSDEIERAWEIVAPLLTKTNPEPYWAGSWGPNEAQKLVPPAGWHHHSR
ncbi:MAG: glucose-6-phosphate dehydrogenase [Actinomycetota bacterium]|nr:glucose-6-phosphate dehydrogenase [Actinomycetota bacterium]